MPIFDFITKFVLCCSMIMSIASVITLIVTLTQKAGSPNRKQDERITILEEQMKETQKHLDSDYQRLKRLDDGNRVVQQSLLAIMSYNLDGGTDTGDKLKLARDNLQKYLIEK